MPRIIILEACLVCPPDQPAAHADIGAEVDLSVPDASYLVRSGRAYYVYRDDDPEKGLGAATEEELRRLRAVAKARSKAVAAPAPAPAPVGGDLVPPGS